MKRIPLLAGLGLLLAGAAVRAGELNVGDPAPDFSLPGSDGKTHSLAEDRDQRAVVLAWFPKAFTGG
jgi:peroxiredoxin Q/BCP